MSYSTYQLLLVLWICATPAVYLLLRFVTAPYGRHTSQAWGPMINNKLAWFLMEICLLVSLFYFVARGEQPQSLTNKLFLVLLTLHYLNRSIVYPLRIRTRGKKMPVIMMSFALVFNTMNGFWFGKYLGDFQVYPDTWLVSLPFCIGMALFVIGMLINWHSDHLLIHLRKPGETHYAIPYGGLFRFVSSPNLLGEVVEWLGFAILTWSLPGLAFFVWTCANLLPRALTNHRWYRERFPDYPTERKALIPFVW